MQHTPLDYRPARVFPKPSVHHVLLAEYVRDFLWALDHNLLKLDLAESLFVTALRQKLASIDAQEDTHD